MSFFNEFWPKVVLFWAKTIVFKVLLAEIEAPILWFWKAKFFLKRVPGEGVRLDRKPVDYDDFQFHPFPLNDLEWSQFMNFGNFETSP